MFCLSVGVNDIVMHFEISSLSDYELLVG